MNKSHSTWTFSKVIIFIVLFLIPWYFIRFSFLGFKTNIFEVATLLAFVALILERANSLTIKKIEPVSVWVYIFLLISLVSMLFSADKTHALGIFKGWFLFPVIFYFLINNSFIKENISKLSIPLFLSLVTVSIWAILQKFGVFGQLFYQAGDVSFRQYILEGRAFGPFESPNFLAMFLVPMIFLSLPLFKEIKNRLLQIIIVLLYFLPLIALYFTTSRGGVVALITSIIAFILFLYFKSKVFRKAVEKQSNILIFGLIFVAAIFLIVAARKVAPNQGGDSIRLDIYHYSITLVKENPILGIGLGNFQEKINQISSADASFQQFGIPYALHPHNLFLAMWLNLGLAGLVVFIILVWLIIQNLFKNKTNPFLKSCVFAALISILVHGLFDTTYFKNDLSTIFWLTFALSFILKKTK